MSILTKAVRRLNADMKEYRAGPIEGTAVYQCEDPMTRLYIAIAGPKDSAYYGGIYFFQFDIPDTYPNEPPKGKFINWQNTKNRMHPNLYVDGKLCLSILGTWSGPSWTSAMTISTIILAIQSILDENPLRNEPGYDKNAASLEHQKYHRIVQYYNYRDFALKSIEMCYKPSVLNKNYEFILYLKDFVVDYYLKNREMILSELKKLLELYPKSSLVSTSYQQCNATIDYLVLIEQWDLCFQQFLANF